MEHRTLRFLRRRSAIVEDGVAMAIFEVILGARDVDLLGDLPTFGGVGWP